MQRKQIQGEQRQDKQIQGEQIQDKQIQDKQIQDKQIEAEHADTETDKIRGIYPDAETQYTGGDLSLWHRPAR